VIITNSAPVFKSNPIDQVVANSANATYQLPEYSDAEDDPITISLTPSLPWVVLSGSTLKITKPGLSAVGITLMSLQLSDGNTVQKYNFKIVVTNQPPAFVINPPSSLTLAMNSESSF
jgi:hypothetical protein